MIGASQARASPAGASSAASAVAAARRSLRASSTRAATKPTSGIARNTAVLAWTRKTSSPRAPSVAASRQENSRTSRKNTVSAAGASTYRSSVPG